MVVLTEVRQTLAVMLSRISHLEAEIQNDLTSAPSWRLAEQREHLASILIRMRKDWVSLSNKISELESELSSYSSDAFEQDIS